jgi:hypothetical protein
MSLRSYKMANYNCTNFSITVFKQTVQKLHALMKSQEITIKSVTTFLKLKQEV